MSHKAFYSQIKKGDDLRLTTVATGFRDGHGPFVSVKIVGGIAEFGFIASPDEVRAIAEALRQAADFADTRVATEADLGIAA